MTVVGDRECFGVVAFSAARFTLDPHVGQEVHFDAFLAVAFAVFMGLVMGGEEKGMRRLTREACDYLVRLPMRGVVESLNVSVATGICLYEAVRQRF